MKRLLCIMLAVIFLSSFLISCEYEVYISSTATDTLTPNDTSAASDTATAPDDTARSDELAAYLKDHLPEMDGSTSTIPLEEALRSVLLEISEDDASAQVAHTTTYGSFYNLLDNKADVIFTTPLSAKQYEIAAGYNFKLELVPIVKEGFVFLVNADNPVDSLTSEQIKMIYSGKITNWSEVGGPDMEIIAYQRNETSGSQNYMIDFMGDIPLAKAPEELLPASMNTLVDAVAAADYGNNGAIGYSVFLPTQTVCITRAAGLSCSLSMGSAHPAKPSLTAHIRASVIIMRYSMQMSRRTVMCGSSSNGC